MGSPLDALMKLVRIDAIAQLVGLDQHVRKQLIIVFRNRVIEMERALTKYEWLRNSNTKKTSFLPVDQ